MHCLLAGCLLAATQNSYTAQLGKPYQVGPKSFIVGTKQELENHYKRVITLHSVRTAIAFGWEQETYIAKAGRKLVVFNATIKNPGKTPISVGPADTFSMRVFESLAKPGEIEYVGACTTSLGPSSRTLKLGESSDVFVVFSFPERSPNLKIATYFRTYDRARDPKYDLSGSIQKPTSVFARSALEFGMKASVSRGQPFDLDDLNFRVVKVEPIQDGYRVRVEVSNPFPKPGRWGWQYAGATIRDAEGRETPHYPTFEVLPEFADWGFAVKSGRPIIGDYLFYPKDRSAPVDFTLTMHSTQRSITVRL